MRHAITYITFVSLYTYYLLDRYHCPNSQLDIPSAFLLPFYQVGFPQQQATSRVDPKTIDPRYHVDIFVFSTPRTHCPYARNTKHRSNCRRPEAELLLGRNLPIASPFLSLPGNQHIFCLPACAHRLASALLPAQVPSLTPPSHPVDPPEVSASNKSPLSTTLISVKTKSYLTPLVYHSPLIADQRAPHRGQ